MAVTYAQSSSFRVRCVRFKVHTKCVFLFYHCLFSSHCFVAGDRLSASVYRTRLMRLILRQLLFKEQRKLATKAKIWLAQIWEIFGYANKISVRSNKARNKKHWQENWQLFLLLLCLYISWQIGCQLAVNQRELTEHLSTMFAQFGVNQCPQFVNKYKIWIWIVGENGGRTI